MTSNGFVQRALNSSTAISRDPKAGEPKTSIARSGARRARGLSLRSLSTRDKAHLARRSVRKNAALPSLTLEPLHPRRDDLVLPASQEGGDGSLCEDRAYPVLQPQRASAASRG